MIAFADLFCGAGGATTGVILATERKGLLIRDGVAINHWPLAVETHSANHPKIRHLCEAIDKVDPCEAVPDGRLDLLWASPECTHFSRARGGRPKQNQSRSGASHILTWLDKLYVKNVIIENVPDFQTWGPLGTDGYPIKSKIGHNFHAFLESLRARNYNVDYRVLNAADFGDATTRERLFVIARRRPLRIVWPEPSHTRGEAGDMFRQVKPWKAVETCIEMKDIGQNLFAKKLKKFVVDGNEVWLPLAPNTLKRIEAGLEEHGGLSFVLGQQSCAAPRTVKQPCPTIATGGGISLVTPFLVQTDQTGSNGNCTRSTKAPMATIVTKQNCALVNCFLTAAKEGSFLLNVAHGRNSKSELHRTSGLGEPVGTLTTKGQYGLTSFILQLNGTSERHLKHTAHSLKEPLRTQAASGHHALCSSFLIQYYSQSRAVSVKEPCPTLSTRDRFLLVNAAANENYELQIFFRLLKPMELAAVHSFPSRYKFAGTKTQQVKQIGNSNPVELTAALTGAVL